MKSEDPLECDMLAVEDTLLDDSGDCWSVPSESFSDSSDVLTLPVDMRIFSAASRSSSGEDPHELTGAGFGSLSPLGRPLSDDRSSDFSLSRLSNPEHKPRGKTGNVSSQSSSVGSCTMDDSTVSSSHIDVPSADALTKELVNASATLPEIPVCSELRGKLDPLAAPVSAVSDFRIGAQDTASRGAERTLSIQDRFLEVSQGPFWSASITPRCRASRSGSAPNPVAQGVSENTATLAQVTSLATSCVRLMSQTLDITPEVSIADSELTTIRMETREQRMQWRDFLSDSVSQFRANFLFNSFDAESSPGQYARPPLSDIQGSNTVSWYGAPMPHIVAPMGAGLAPLDCEAARAVAKPLGVNVHEMRQSDHLDAVRDVDPYPPGFSDGSRTNLRVRIEAV
uniref:Uncharacterized protein n=1 Tax=Noctiluca scintillans TaxID=2966 RepID=A0A7S1A2I2_NOCSC|mmetsp:Transcript_28897/g.76257  ORF Transcript_28897/g.76257 Transcript_28897/m.76257 type:complete len:398 (+) Transcript_28897:49-1242(+)